MRSSTLLPAISDKLCVEARIKDAEANGVGQHLLVSDQHAIEHLGIRGGGIDRGLARDLDLDDAAALEHVGQVGLREREEEIERGKQRTRLKVGDVGAAAMAGLDDAQR